MNEVESVDAPASVSRAVSQPRGASSVLLEYVVAVLIAAGTVLIRLLLDGYLADRAPLALLVAAVALAAWRGGWKAGLLAGVVGYVLSAYLFIPVRGSLIIENPARELIAALFYIAACTVVVLMIEHWRAAKRQLADSAVSQELLAAIVLSSDDAILSVDLDGIITSWNPGAERLYGWTAEEALGQPMSMLVPTELREKEERILESVRRAQRIAAHETVRCRKDGSPVDVLLSVSPIHDATGAIVGASKVASDRTARLRAQRAAVQADEARRASDQRLSAVLESIDDHLVSYDLQWRYSFVNEAAARTLHKTIPELLGRSIWELFPESIGNQYYRELHDAVRERRIIRSEHYYEPWDSWFENHIYPNDDGVTVFSANITVRKRAEQALKDADRRKDEFIAVLAHELRNPLAPIRNAARILEKARHQSTESGLALDIIGRQLEHLVRLVDDLLDVSRINRGHLDLQKAPIALSDVIDNAIESVRPQVESRQHRLTVVMPEERIVLDADPTRLTQVFVNLLGNAARYTPEGGDIRLTTGVVGDKAVISVRDTGIGIPTNMLVRVFDMFTQVDRSLERANGGLGIGLTLVNRLVTLHGGTVEARSKGPGTGCEFVVSLPVADPAALTSAQRHRARVEAAPSSRRILVVDDNTDSADTLAMLFRFRNHEVCVAYDGQAAVELAESFAPDTVLLDIGLPVMNGYDVASQLRKAQGGADLLLIAVSGWGQEQDRQRSKEVGFDHHLVKPVDYKQLIPLVERERAAV